MNFNWRDGASKQKVQEASKSYATVLFISHTKVMVCVESLVEFSQMISTKLVECITESSATSSIGPYQKQTSLYFLVEYPKRNQHRLCHPGLGLPIGFLLVGVSWNLSYDSFLRQRWSCDLSMRRNSGSIRKDLWTMYHVDYNSETM